MFPSKRTNLDIGVAKQTKDLFSSSTEELDNLKINKIEPCVASCEFSALRISLLHPSNRLELLHQYVQILAELSQEKVSLCLSVNQRVIVLRLY